LPDPAPFADLSSAAGVELGGDDGVVFWAVGELEFLLAGDGEVWAVATMLATITVRSSREKNGRKPRNFMWEKRLLHQHLWQRNCKFS